MKKFASMVAAGAILMSTVGVAFAYDYHHSYGSGVNQYSFTHSETVALSGTGDNVQSGAGSSTQSMVTGGSGAGARSLTAGNVNVGGRSVRQYAFTGSETVADSYTGGNTQVATATSSHHHHSSGTTTQSMVTGGSGATSGSITVSNVNLSFH